MLLSISANAQQTVLPCTNVTTNGKTTCVPVSATNQLPIGVYDSGNHTGYCYTSNGSGSPATFQACGSGGSMAIGGAIAGSTAGSVLFVGSGNVLAQDNSNFHWDDTNYTLAIGTPAYTDTGIAIAEWGNTNSYFQDIVSNVSSGSLASADRIVSNNLGYASGYYGDFGMDSSNYSNGSDSLDLPNAVYLYSQNGDLALGTKTNNAIHFETNNSNTDAITIASSGNSTFNGTASFLGTNAIEAEKLRNAAELINIVAAAPSSTQTFYLASGAVQYYTTSAANNWTINFAWSSGTSMNTAMAVGDSVTIAMLTTQGSTAYYANAFQIDGTSVTPKWVGGTAPSAGNASGIDSYTCTIIKTASATYTELCQQTQYK